MNLEQLLEPLLKESVTLLLRNEYGTMELRGDDLRLKCSEAWLTIYHGSATDSESQSHLHLRRHVFGFASVREREGKTPTLEFWPDAWTAARTLDGSEASGLVEPHRQHRPRLSVIFPSFYDWQNEQRPLLRNREWFGAWLARHGSRFELQ